LTILPRRLPSIDEAITASPSHQPAFCSIPSKKCRRVTNIDHLGSSGLAAGSARKRAMNGYRDRVWNVVAQMMSGLDIHSALDVGAGDGWFAASTAKLATLDVVEAIDISVRSKSFYDVKIYDGQRIPFGDKEFDLVYAVDVAHHTDDPQKFLAELVRCSQRYLLLKDHTWKTSFDWVLLAVRDELGNRRFGVRSVYNYQRAWEWDSHLERAGMKRVRLVHPLRCHWGPMAALANGSEFLSLWKRI
jgi:SAM-dependent methyltransferase